MTVKRREGRRSGRAVRIAEGFAASRSDWLGKYRGGKRDKEVEEMSRGSEHT